MTTPDFTTNVASTVDRPLRRKARELTLEQAREVIEFTEHAVLSTCDSEGNPYGVPISPVLVGNVLYFHATAQPGGRKADNMLMNPRVSVCFIGKATTLPEWYSVDFASAVVTGRASPVTDKDEQIRAWTAILKRHAPKNSAERNSVQGRVRGPLAMIWKIEIERITGKARGAAKWEAGKSLTEVQDMGPSEWLKGVPL
ncbi:pyridoxamine 5'-phosphate oxidase family protein [Sutterella sp.]|uniref:pyridoxamine 5'-phosphate oxidase family protein n=1 Tax=Sutterella sp. TaxID=1981025 RepID=UPI0026DFC4E5|nr:pyridoxamine 5'-phosphate oxidase family protein [Sutterella sp.]MDO5531755.1 pyridoxamine 5'-phosphate oxidase family protein [Sutterella sp.]